jgi:hypothetical protein
LKNTFLFFNLLLSPLFVFSQVNALDSTFQVISYFDKGEKQNYSISTEKYSVSGIDTAWKEKITYEVEITVLDSSEKEYTIEWFYKNFNVDKTSGNPSIDRLNAIANNCKVIYKTDEMGTFKEVVNWKEVRDFVNQSFELIKKDIMSDSNLENIYRTFQETYSSKESIESVAIQDIIHFHSFHGAKYKLGEELRGVIKLPNVYGKEPFDAEFVAYLDELNFEDLNGILRYEQVVDKTQLADATYRFMCDLAKNTKQPKPDREIVSDLSNEVIIATCVHNSGWIIYSLETKMVKSGEIYTFTERTIELQ